MSIRIGQGYDVHRFGEGDHLMLGGIKVPYIQGFIAHSDGDVLIHALCDALLGALSLGDIGHHFPDTDSAYKNIDSSMLLKHVMRLLHDEGYELVNMDATLIAQAPKLAPYIDDMRQSLAECMQVEKDQVSIKATTTETLGFTGRKEGIAAQVVVLVSKSTHQ